MHRVHRALVGAIIAITLSPAVVSAGPPISFGFTVDCTDGTSFDINFGAPKNQGTAIHIVGDNGILTSNGYMVTTDGVAIVFSPRGLPAVDAGNGGVVCVGGFEYDDESGHHVVEYTITGWVTPRG